MSKLQACQVAHTTASLTRVAQEMLGPGTPVAGGPLKDWTCPLWPEEEKVVARALPKRRQEFIAGRAAARRAMSVLGVPPTSLPRRSDGPPCWPTGLTGSITHGGGYVLAAVRRDHSDRTAVGIDLEALRSLPVELTTEICRPDEDHCSAIRIFSAKEAVYKAQFMLTGHTFGFSALRVSLETEERFSAELMLPIPGFYPGSRFLGRQTLVGSLVLSSSVIN